MVNNRLCINVQCTYVLVLEIVWPLKIMKLWAGGICR